MCGSCLSCMYNNLSSLLFCYGFRDKPYKPLYREVNLKLATNNIEGPKSIMWSFSPWDSTWLHSFDSMYMTKRCSMIERISSSLLLGPHSVYFFPLLFIYIRGAPVWANESDVYSLLKKNVYDFQQKQELALPLIIEIM
jgi:hypothetical protein